MHCTENNKNDYRAEWGYQVLFSWCTSKKVAVAILFNNNFTFQISKTYSDPEGRFIIYDLTVNGKQLTLTNIYAPKNDDSNFFTSVVSHLADFKCDEIIIGGDFKKNLEYKLQLINNLYLIRVKLTVNNNVFVNASNTRVQRSFSLHGFTCSQLYGPITALDFSPC